MTHPLLDCERIDIAPAPFLRSIGTVFAEYGEATQDSGNVSYGVSIGPERFFVKTAGVIDNPRPHLPHAARVALLRNAARLNAAIEHPMLPRLLRVIESPDGPLLVYPWLEGELLGVPRERRDDPQSPFQRFRNLPAARLVACLDGVFDLHAALAQVGWMAGDFYDGSLLYDFAADRLWVVDLDCYHDGPFTNQMGRMFGSTRFMAPEEFEHGARIDEQTTVFTMGRTGLIFLGDGSTDPATFRGSPAAFTVLAKACAPERAERFESMAAFLEEWRSTQSG